MIEIEGLEVAVEEKTIIKDFSLKVNPGEIHAIMGPNGAGKSTLAKALAGHPFYEVVKGTALLEGHNLLGLEPEERAQLGLFMSFQYPLEISGISNLEFLRYGYNALHACDLNVEQFRKKIMPILTKMKIKEHFLERDLNDGFSGGEKKQNEVLQMLVLDPKCSILDETDSGLDIDALRLVSNGVNQFMNEERSLILITHYQRLLDYVRPDFVHVMIDGKIVKSGDSSLAKELEEIGYQTC